jgi:hypothetical protein
MRTSNIERRTLNVEQKRAKGTAGTTRLSLCGSKFDVRCSKFEVRSSMFDVRCSKFEVRCSLFDVGERSIPAIGPDEYTQVPKMPEG